MNNEKNNKKQLLEEMQQIRALQTEIVTLRTELPKEYVKLLKRDYNTYVENLQSGQCFIPDNLAVNIVNDSELPTIDVPPSIFNLQQNEEEEIKNSNNKLRKLSTLMALKNIMEK